MKPKQNLKITLIEVDNLDEENHYYLYEVEGSNQHYYYCTSDEERLANDSVKDYSNAHDLIERSDMNDKEWHIANVLFEFLWTSSNGTNTCMDYEQLAEEDITQDDIIAFINKFNLQDDLDYYEEDGVEIYWGFLCSFDLTTCDFFGDR